VCFGNTSTTQTQSYTPPGWLTSAANNNVGFAQQLQNAGFTPYSGNQVASFSPQQAASFGLGSQIAGGVAPYVGEAGSLIANYANAGPQSVTPQTIAQNMSPYMNQYVGLALQPQLAALQNQEALQSQLMQGQATSAGAFGDPRANMLQQNQNFLNGLQNAGVVGNAYNAAFNTAIGAGAQDVSNNLAGQTTNANLAETALGRQLTGANALSNVGTGATNLINTLGGQQTAQTQAQLNAAYNQWLMGQQYPFQTLQANDQALMAARGAVPTSTTTSAPNNAGYGLLGAGLGAVGTILGGPIGGMVGSSLGLGNYTGQQNINAGYGYGLGYDQYGYPQPINPPGYADGGSVKAHKPILVGERGPELFVPNKHGLVIPAEVLQAARMLKARKTGIPGGLSSALRAA